MFDHVNARKLALLICVIGVFVIFISACSSVGFQQYTTTTSPVIIDSVTPAPTETPTLSPTENPFEIDEEKFHNFPESYEYLLTHPDEFVQAPDPLTNRVKFDEWWSEEFIPVVGEITHEREVDVRVEGYSYFSTSLVADASSLHLFSLPQFFYFESQGTLYAVPVFNVQILDYTPGKTNATMAVILCDTKYWTATSALARISAGEDFKRIEIFSTRVGDYQNIAQFIDAGFVPTGDVNDPKMPPVFGPGRIQFGSGDFIDD